MQVIEDELRERIERLETRQATDDASLLILNRYWNQVTPLSKMIINKYLLYEDVKFQIIMLFGLFQFDENIRLIIRRYDQASSEPEKSPAGEGRSLKPETPEPDGDSNQERAKDRGKNRTYQRIITLKAVTLKKPKNGICYVAVIQATKERQTTPSWPRWLAAAVRRWRQSFRRGWSLARSRLPVCWRSMNL